MVEKNKYCCENHIDMAFDDFLDENEIFPHMDSIVDKKCTYCEKDAKYILRA